MKKHSIFLCLLLPAIVSCGRPASEQQPAAATIQIKGSDTELNLVQRLAEQYMKKAPDARISVTGGGSGTGIAALINKSADIANSSRAMEQSERDQAKANGVDPWEVVFAMDGLSVIVHPSNSVASLSLDQLGRIYRGEIKNWKEVRGPDAPISLYGRQSNSGTFVYFRKTVVKGDYSTAMKQMNGNAQIVEAVKSDKSGIGYVGLGYIKDRATGKVISGIKALTLGGPGPALSPLDPTSISSGKYPLLRPLFHYTNGKPSVTVLNFIRFELSDEGQSIVEHEGFLRVNEEYQKQNSSKIGS
ncbi:MAG TPA: PstS family phosphate ABC transporter substrate-binding protein [Acidobacteriota bacterium]|jgi:phosphate transport system substrate-binding protein